MTRLDWNTPGTRYYETGVDRGVLYVGTDPGVAWTGLISVSETPSGGEPKPFYIDGQKYLNLATAEEFEASVAAFSSPLEFGPCDGMKSIQNGLFVTQQPRKQFGLTYRTQVGNDTQGVDHAYKIHIVYNALSGPSQRASNTQGESADPTVLQWEVTTLAPTITGYRPTAHMVVDTRYTDPEVLLELEDILYGNESFAPALPTPTDLIALFA